LDSLNSYKDNVLSAIKVDILANIVKDMCFETKRNSLDALSWIAQRVTTNPDNIQGHLDLADGVWDDGVPAKLVAAMVSIAKCSRTEIYRFRAERDLWDRTTAGSEYRTNLDRGREPWMGMTGFLYHFAEHF
jgi:hypothetical protein